jgi:hypothetical protein
VIKGLTAVGPDTIFHSRMDEEVVQVTVLSVYQGAVTVEEF